MAEQIQWTEASITLFHSKYYHLLTSPSQACVRASDGRLLRGEVNPGQSERIKNLNHVDSCVLYDGAAKFFSAGSALL